MTDPAQFDLDAYLLRINQAGDRRPDATTLRDIHLAHVQAIPFENLDALHGTAPSLAPADLMAKMVHSRRGGYCYEHNTLFACALTTLGFRVTRLAARVMVGEANVESRPRTHMALLVEVPGDPQPYLADVGFGTIGALLEPVPLTVGMDFYDAGRRHRLMHVPNPGPLQMWVLEAFSDVMGRGIWQGQYAFTLEPFEQCDFEVINWYIGTSPRSPFTQRLYVHRVTSDKNLLLTGCNLTETHADGTVRERKITDEATARRLLDEAFGITAPETATLLPSSLCPQRS